MRYLGSQVFGSLNCESTEIGLSQVTDPPEMTNIVRVQSVEVAISKNH